MARKGKKPASRSAPKAKVVAPTPTPPSKDPRPWIYGGLDILFAVSQAVLIWRVVPNRLPSAAFHLWTLPIAMFAMGIGTMLRSRIGWKIAVIAGSVALLSTVLLIARIIVSAAFLSGVYGAFGKAAAMTALTAVALLVELVALLPIVQVKYLLTRAGRHVYGMPLS
ncbi:MAG: hypothetical protein AB7T06_04205 [Kofleriaceae bacterium]